jgi:hypothetical protein
MLSHDNTIHTAERQQHTRNADDMSIQVAVMLCCAVQACYIRLPPSARRACESLGYDFREGVHAASHALLNVLPLFMVCNSNDVGTEVRETPGRSSRPGCLVSAVLCCAVLRSVFDCCCMCAMLARYRVPVQKISWLVAVQCLQSTPMGLLLLPAAV